jgi:glycosyl transferase family 25
VRCFLINLDRSPERLAATRHQLDGLGLPWERVAAVDGEKLVLPDRAFVNETAFRRRHHALLRRGEIGCYLSHYRTLQRFLASDASAGLILEDDVELPSDLPAILAALSACPEQWDLVKLHVTHPGGIITRLTLRQPYRLVSLAFRHGSSAAYIVNRKAAEKLVKGLLPMTVPYDHEFDRAWKYRFKLRAVLPPPVTRRRLPSTISRTSLADPTAKAANSRMHKPWYRQGGMVLFRGMNDVQRVLYELRPS